MVCVVGTRSGGGYPSKTEAEPFKHLLPASMPRASYTQWEFLLARDYKIQILLCPARSDYVPDEAAAADDTELQTTFLRHIENTGISRLEFTNNDQLRATVLSELARAQALVSKPVVLPFPSIRALFKGREGYLRDIHTALSRPDGRPAAITAQLAVQGLGGVGKTRAAVEYAWTHHQDYAALLCVNADSPEALTRNLAALTGPLGMPEYATQTDDVRLPAVLDWLGRHPGWLLILDNIDSNAAIAESARLLGRLTHGSVLLTTRLTNLPSGFTALPLDVLAVADAVSLLLDTTQRRTRAPDDPAQAKELANDLGRLALALAQAGAYIDRMQCSLAAYRTRLRTSFAAVMAWSDKTVTQYERGAVAATLALSVAQLTEPGRTLLERLSWLAPEPVPVSLLDVPVPGATGDPLEALADLAAYSLVTRDTVASTFLAHRLVLDVTRLALPEAMGRQRLEEALTWVNAAFSEAPGDVRNWPRLDPLAEHAWAAVLHADAAGIAEPTARLMGALDVLFQAKAQYRRAEQMSRAALSIVERTKGEMAPELATRLNNLAQLLQAANRLGEAEPLMRRALAIDEASYGAAHPNVATDLNNLAQLLKATNRLGEAEPLMRRALAIDEASYGAAHPNVAIRLNNLAQLLQATNRLGEAEPLMRRALAIDEASYGDAHPNVARDLNNLAGLLRATNRLGEAEPLMRRPGVIFLMFQRDTGHAHPHRDAVLNNYAMLLKEMGRSDAEIAAEHRAMMREAGLA